MTDPDLLDARRLQAIHDVHQLLQLHTAVAAQEHFLRRAIQQGLAYPLLENLDANRIVAQIDHARAAIGERHVDEDALARDRRAVSRLGQLHVEALLHHRRCHHEDDEQHEHHVDQRHDVDLRQHGRDAARSPATCAFS